LRIVRKIAVLSLVAAPLGAVLAIGQAGAIASDPTVGTPVSAVALAQTYGAENFNVLFTSAVSGEAVNAGDYPEGDVTFIASQTAPPIGTHAIDDNGSVTGVSLCDQDWSDVALGDLTAGPPAVVSYHEVCSGLSAALLGAGTWYIYAGFIADSPSSPLGGFSYNDTNSASAIGPIVISKATPTLTTDLTNTVSGADYGTGGTNVPGGASVTDTGTLAGTGPFTGTVTFTVHSGAACVGAVLSTSPGETVSGTTAAYTFTAPNAGNTFSIAASYSGDANNNAANATCEGTFTTVQATPAVSTVATNATNAPSPIQDTATITGLNGTGAGGSVTFTAQSGSCTGPGVFSTVVLLNPGLISGTTATVVAQWPTTVQGTYFWSVSYSGDVNNAPVTEACGGTNETSTVGAPVPPPPPPGPVLTIHPSQLNEALRGHFYFQALSATGGTPSYVFSIGGGALPPGLHLSANGFISGMAGAVGDYTVTINVTDHSSPTAGFGSRTYVVDVDA